MPCENGKFKPSPNENLRLPFGSYTVQPHPKAAHLPFSAEGRRAVVYNLRSNNGSCALKVFKRKYRTADLLKSAVELQRLANLPGLLAAKRSIVSPTDKIATDCPDLAYATLMPWITGTTWNDLLLSAANNGGKGHAVFDLSTALKLAKRFLAVMEGLERISVAHTDIAPGNVMLSLAAGDVQLLDLEDLYLPGSVSPAVENTGTPGYRHPSAELGESTWRGEGDRYAVAIMTAEFLLVSEPALGKLASDTGFFDGNRDSNVGSERYDTARSFLEAVAPAFAQQFKAAWHSATLQACPSIAEFGAALSNAVVVEPATAVPGVSWIPIGTPQYMTAAGGAAGSGGGSSSSGTSSFWVPPQAPPAPTPPAGLGSPTQGYGVLKKASTRSFGPAVWIITALIALAAVIIFLAVHNARVQKEREQSAERQHIADIERIEAERRKQAEDEERRKRAQQEEERRKSEQVVESLIHSGATAVASGDMRRFEQWIRGRISVDGSQLLQVKFADNCSKSPLYLAIRYQVPDGSGVWVTTGWWNLSPGESVSPLMGSTNVNVYFYAESQDRSLSCAASNKPDAVEEGVVDEHFMHGDGATSSGHNPRNVAMRHLHFADAGAQDFNLTCN